MALRRGPITLPKSGFGFSEARPILGRVLAILLSQLVELLIHGKIGQLSATLGNTDNFYGAILESEIGPLAASAMRKRAAENLFRATVQGEVLWTYEHYSD